MALYPNSQLSPHLISANLVSFHFKIYPQFPPPLLPLSHVVSHLGAMRPSTLVSFFLSLHSLESALSSAAVMSCHICHIPLLLSLKLSCGSHFTLTESPELNKAHKTLRDEAQRPFQPHWQPAHLTTRQPAPSLAVPFAWSPLPPDACRTPSLPSFRSPVSLPRLFYLKVSLSSSLGPLHLCYPTLPVFRASLKTRHISISLLSYL